MEPFHLFDCCQENDGAAAMIFVSADRAKDYAKTPVYFLGGAVGSGNRAGSGSHNATDYATSNFKTVAPRMYDMAQIKPEEVDVAQVYENFTGGVVMSIIEHGLTSYEEANEFITFDNLIAPSGKMPINTSGGNLAECYMHGLELNIEAVRQVRGESCNQVDDVNVSLVAVGSDGDSGVRHDRRLRGGALMANPGRYYLGEGMPRAGPIGRRARHRVLGRSQAAQAVRPALRHVRSAPVRS